MTQYTKFIFLNCNQHSVTITVSDCCLTKLLPYILFEKNIYAYILALEMVSPEKQHCANCIGALSSPIK